MNPSHMNTRNGSSDNSNRLNLSPETLIPRKKIWIIVANSEYSKARSNQSLSALREMKDVAEKVHAVKEGIMNLGGQENDIRFYENISRKHFTTLFENLNNEVIQEQAYAEERGEESATMVFFYYIGHGICQSLTSVLSNDKNGRFFPLERELRLLGQ